MFTITYKSAKAEIKKQEELDAIIQNVTSNGYATVVRGAVQAICTLAGVPKGAIGPKDMIVESPYYGDPEREPVHYLGDLFVKEHSLFVLGAVGPRIEAYEIRKQTSLSSIEEFCKAIHDAAKISLDGRRLRGMEFSWTDAPPGRYTRRLRMRRRQTSKLDEKQPEYTAEDAARAALIATRERRTFLLSLAQSRGKVRRTDTSGVSESDIIVPLVKGGVIRSEYLILCRKDSHTICTVACVDKLSSETEGMKCSECGRSLKDERSQEIYALTETGKMLLEKSRWMSIWVTECLKTAGLKTTEIAWNASAAEDELDVIATVLGQQVFLELKDREFGLGDAYPFAFRVNRYGGDYGVIVTTERVAEEATKFLNEPMPGVERQKFRVVEGEEGIPDSLRHLVHEVSQVAIRGFIGSLSERFGINLVAVVHAWMKREEHGE